MDTTVTTAADAHTRGLEVYFPGRPCGRDHVAARWTLSGDCVECVPEQQTPDVVSWSDAKRRGLAYYFTGRPCTHGHVALRRMPSGKCVGCDRTKPERRPRVALEVISRKDARARGQTWYYTGKPCVHGHVTKRWVSTARCCRCTRESTNRWMRRQFEHNTPAADRMREKWRREGRTRLLAWYEGMAHAAVNE